MKLSLIILFIGLTPLLATTYAQTATLSISAKNETLENVLHQIEKQSEFLFFYNLDEINTNEKVSVNKADSSIDEIMKEISGHTGISYWIRDRHIVLTPASMTNPDSKQQSSRQISGVVLDTMNEPIIGANIIVKGVPGQGTVTDIDGQFTINVSEDAILQISYIGYINQEIPVRNQNTLRIVLQENTQTLDEVIVVGYGTMKKKDLTGAVSSVKLDDTPVATISTISHALAGKAAGLQVSTVSAQPGGGSTFRIRGAASVNAGNDPLIIIDGFPVSSAGNVSAGKYDSGTFDNILASLNPNDIESIEVLKDASSTAIYGARAGNGVIIITTKKGKSGKPQVKYSGTATIQTMAKKYEMLNAREFMIESNRYYKEEWMRSNKLGPYGDAQESSVAPFTPRYSDAEISNPINNTDWFDEITRTGFQTQHNVSIAGGNENTKYLTSINYFNQQGVIKENGMERYTGRVNLEHTLSKYIKTGINLTLSRNAFDNVPLGAGQNQDASIMVAAAQFNPILPVKDEEGNYVLNSEAAYLPNPASLLEISDRTVKDRVLANAFIEIEPLQGLTLKGNFGFDRNYQKRKTYLPQSTLYGQMEGGRADIAQQDNLDYLMDLTATYTKKIKDHNFTVLGGYSFQSYNYDYVTAGNKQFLIDGFLANNLGAGAGEKPTVGSSASKDELASFFGRVNYSFKDRYLLTATFRADGSSVFAKNHRWGYFPSVALGWRFTEEDFMDSIRDIISNGKLRISYGETGNSNIGTRTLTQYAVGNNNQFGDVEYKGVYTSQFGNPDLKWETTREWNFGIDLGFLDNRINVTAEYFNRVISDLLSTRSLLSYHEVSSIAANIGKTQSKGFELTINTRNIDTRDFSWTSDLTFSFYRDRWKERADTWVPEAYQSYNDPIRYAYGYLSDGIIQVGEEVPHMPGALPGQVKLKDISGYIYNEDGSIKVDENGKALTTGEPDGTLNNADIVIYGSTDPGYIAGFNNNFRYKNFDLGVYFYGQFDLYSSGSYKGLWLTGANGMTGIVNMYRGYNMPVTAKEVWTHDNQTASHPGYFQNESTRGIGDFYAQKIWFIRCRNITLGYTLPPLKSNKVFSNMRVYLDVNNPFVISNYDGLDPETDNNVWAYPNVRSFSIGLDITF